MSLGEIAHAGPLSNATRLGIMLYLLPRRKALFADLQRVLGLTPGNLDSHIKTLERHGYVEIRKVIRDRPRTAVYITELGERETWKYVEKLRRALEEAGNV